MSSPKLREFVNSHPGTLEVLTNTVSKVFNGRTVQIFYYYTSDESTARTYHYYPSESSVGVCVRENQEPLDEFICIVFESLNSAGEKQFKELFREAALGVIPREEFAQEMLKLEFNAVKSTRKLVSNLKVSDKERSESHFYKRFTECPDDFKDFIAYIKRDTSRRDPIKEFEARYDSMHSP